MSRALLREGVDHSELAHRASEIREYQAHQDWDKYRPEHHDRLRDGSCLVCQREKGEEIPKLPWIGVCVLLLLLSLPALGQATYSGAGTRRGTASYAVNEGEVATGAGENVYCPAGASGELTEGTPTWGSTDGVANLPTQCMNTAVASTPSGTHIGGGAATTWTPADGPALTALLNGSNLLCGDTIQLTAGQIYIDTATFTFPAPACDGGHWITVKSSGISDAAFPAEGTRATPCIIGLANDATNGRQVPGYPDYSCASYPTVLTAKIQAPAVPGQSAIEFASEANHYRFIGIEVTKSAGYRPGQLISLAADGVTLGANHIIFDRDIIHGVGWTAAGDIYTETQSGLAAKNSQWVALINSWNYDTYCNSSCVDSQGFSAGTGASPGRAIQGLQQRDRQRGREFHAGRRRPGHRNTEHAGPGISCQPLIQAADLDAGDRDLHGVLQLPRHEEPGRIQEWSAGAARGQRLRKQLAGMPERPDGHCPDHRAQEPEQ